MFTGVMADIDLSDAPGSMLSERGLLGKTPPVGSGSKGHILSSTFRAPSIILFINHPFSLFAFLCPPASSV